MPSNEIIFSYKQQLEGTMAKRKSKKLRAKINQLKEDILYYIYSPVRLFKKLCFWVGFAVNSFSLAMLAAAMIFYFNLPSSEEISFENAKQIAIQKINKRSEK